jgi:uncharacterized protein YdbL (DUF1318 family)
MKRFRMALIAVLVFWAGSVMALELSEAKSAGMVGEQPDGYLGVVQSSQAANRLVQEINAKRKEAYRDIALKNQLTLEQVGAVAGKKLINKANPGEYIKGSQGQWIRK